MQPELAALLLFARERGLTSVKRLAAAANLSVEQAELLICRALATLIRRGYQGAALCELFSVTPEQLSRAAKAPAFGPDFQPIGAWAWGRC